jgi:hypothetical protein
MSTRPNRFEDYKFKINLSLNEKKSYAKELLNEYYKNKNINCLKGALNNDNTNNDIVYNYLSFLIQNSKIKDKGLKDKYKNKYKECIDKFKIVLSKDQLKNLGLNEKSQIDVFYDLIKDIKEAKDDDYDKIINKLRGINDKYYFNNNISIDNLNLYYYMILTNIKNIILGDEKEKESKDIKEEDKSKEHNKTTEIKDIKDEDKTEEHNKIMESKDINNNIIKIEKLKVRLNSPRISEILEYYKKKNSINEKEKNNFNLFFFTLLRADPEKLVDFSDQFDDDEKENKNIINYNLSERDNKKIIENFTKNTFNDNKKKIGIIQDYDYKIQKYLRLSKFNETHFYKKYLDDIKIFFKNILKSKVIQSLIEFIYHSEYKNILNVYSDKIINEIFDELYFLPYELDKISAMSDADSCSIFTSGLILIPKDYEQKNLFEFPEVKILNFGKITIILTHEIIGHIIKIYLKKLNLIKEDNSPPNNNLYNSLKDRYKKNEESFNIVQEFKKNIDNFEDDEEGGNQIEIFLYGDIKSTISINESLYLLDLNNYNKYFNDFKNDFVKISKLKENDQTEYEVKDCNDLLTKDLYKSLLLKFNDKKSKKNFNVKHKFKKGNFNSLTIEFGRCGTNKIKKKRGRLIKLPEFELFELTNEDNEENFNE